jgi:hypothetical protein
LDVPKKRGPQDPTRPKEKLFDGPTVGRTPCSGKRKKKRRIFSVQRVLSNTKRQLQKTEYNA